MNPREKRMAIAVGAMLGLAVLYYGYSAIAGKFSDREHQLDDLNQKIAKQQTKIDAGLKAQKKMKDWEARSLPSDAKLAPSLYESWLVRQLDESKLDSANVQRQDSQQTAMNRTATFEKYAFQVKATTDITMKELVSFLYKFYSSNQLQKIRQLTLKPHNDGRELDVTIDIEALLLPGADRNDKLSTAKLDQLALGDAQAYEKIIGSRNLFSEYTPQRTQVHNEPKKTPPVDLAKYTTITGIIEQNDEPQIWVLIKTTGQMLKLREGDDFKVGDLKCKVVKIGVRDAVITTEGKNVQVSVGDSLRDGTPMPSDEL